MSKKRVVEIIDQAGNSFGQINNPVDFLKAQDFSHAHVEQVTQDFLINPDTPEIAGCDYAPTSGLGMQIFSGRIYRYGTQYDVAEQIITLNPAHAIYARIDLIIATLADDVPASTEFLAFQQIRTDQEFINSQPPYPPTQFQRFAERHNVGPVSVKTGIPAANPLAPALAADEVVLYMVLVPANATVLDISNITDLRRKVSNISGITQELIDYLARLKMLEDQIRVLIYRYPTILSGDGRCPATLLQDENGVWVVDIPIGVDVEFGDAFVKIRAEKFTDPIVNPRYVNISNGVVTYLPLIESNGNPGNDTTGNVIRYTVQDTTKTLFLNRQGQLFFRDVAAPSNTGECVLLKTTRNGANTNPILKRYRNLRNSISGATGTKVANEVPTFEMDLGVPEGVLYVEAYAERAADNVRYSIPLPALNFDGTVTISGVIDGDKWNVRFFILSAL